MFSYYYYYQSSTLDSIGLFSSTAVGTCFKTEMCYCRRMRGCPGHVLMFIGLVIELLITIRVFPKTTSSLTQRYTYTVLQIIQMNLLLFLIWADRAVLGSTETAQQKLK